MPTYVYECRDCNDTFEVEQRITEDALTDCKCGGRLRRLIQPVGIAFKGSGFYVNDSTSKPAAKSETAPASETPAASSSTTPASTDSAPATPSPASAPAEAKSE